MGQFRHIFQAGTYIIGDLCYVVTDPQWGEICNQLDEEGDESCRPHRGRPYTLADGSTYGILGTQNGDGNYESNGFGTYPVDSGTLGCLLITADKQGKPLGKREAGLVCFDADFELTEQAWDAVSRRLVHLVTFDEPFEIVRQPCGDLEFGNVTIVTDYPYEEEEEDDDGAYLQN